MTFSKERSANLRVEPVGYPQSRFVHLSVATVSLAFLGENKQESHGLLAKFNTHPVLRRY